MRRSDPDRVDLRGWLAVAWAALFAGLYLGMVLQARASGLLDAVRSRLGR